jgi:hypothetical protein
VIIVGVLDLRLGLLIPYTHDLNVTANLHNSQITRADSKRSHSSSTSRFLVKDLNNGDSSATVFTSLPAG